MQELHSGHASHNQILNLVFLLPTKLHKIEAKVGNKVNECDALWKRYLWVYYILLFFK